MVLYSRSGDELDRGLVGYWKLDDLKRIATDGIVAHYKMNDDAENTNVVDSKSGNNGTAARNTSLFSTLGGKIDRALDFNGTTDIIDVADGENMFNGLSEVSISLWVKADAIGTDKGFIYGDPHADIEDDTISMRYDLLGANGGGDNVIKCVISTTGGDAILESSENIQTTNWQHIVLTWKSGSQIKLYVDGSLDTPTSVSSIRTGTITSLTEFFIGVGKGSQFWAGLIDDVRVYNREISLSEVSSIHNSGNGTETTELFRDTIVAIERANFNDGTITGATATTDMRGIVGNAMFFDGVDDSVSAVDAPTLRSTQTNDWSIAAWHKREATAGGSSTYTVIFGKKDFNRWGLIQENSFAVSGNVFIPPGEVSDRISTGYGSALNNQTWVHSVFTYDSKTGRSKIYHNGVLQKSEIEEGPNPLLDGTNPVNIGGRSIDNVLSFFGSIKNCRIYKRVLTQGQVSKLFRLKK